MDTSSMFFTIACAAYSILEIFRSIKDKNKGYIGNQAQNVISVGVLFTFVGVAIGLMNFDTNPDTMGNSINIFLSGMKTAFYTSIIGMIAALIIKYIQSSVESSADQRYKDSLDDIKEISFAVTQNTDVIKAALKDLKDSVDADSTETLSAELNNFSSVMQEFITASKNSQQDMKLLSDSMASQANLLSTLSNSLTQSISALGQQQENQLQAMERMFSENISQLSEQLGHKLQVMNTDLSQSISESGKNQLRQLEAMNASIETMRESSVQAAEHSKELLANTIAFQNESLQNEAKQNEILQANTSGIIGMRDSFADFVENVQKVFGDAVINALNDSMQRLNDQLETQFGDNFKELNAAVKDVVKWQEEYKDIVEKTTTELQLINDVFNQFVNVVSKNVSEHIDSLNTNLQQFTDTSNKNVAIQETLHTSTSQLAEMVSSVQNNIIAIEGVLERFQGFTDAVVAETDKALEEHRNVIETKLQDLTETMVQSNKAYGVAFKETVDQHCAVMRDEVATLTSTTNELNDNIAEMKNTALTVATDTNHYMRTIGETSQNVVKEIGITLERFHNDFSSKTEDAISNLEGMFEVVAKNTDKQQAKAVQSLAVALAKISNQMIDNYSVLIARIAELDKLVRRNGGDL